MDNLKAPKSPLGKTVLVLAIIALVGFALCNLCGTQLYEFAMGGVGYSFDNRANEQIIKLQEAVNTQCGIGAAKVSSEGFRNDPRNQSDYGWSNGHITCDASKQDQIQCTC